MSIISISALSAWPPYGSWGERIVSQLRAVNIRTQANTIERAAFYERLVPGPNRLKGLILILSGAPGDAAARAGIGLRYAVGRQERSVHAASSATSGGVTRSTWPAISDAV